VSTEPRPEVLHGFVMADYGQMRATLRAAQIRRGPSQSELARRTGMSRPQVSYWLGDDAGAGMQRAFSLAHALGYDLALIPRKDTP